VFPIELPPLRERKDDIPMLIDHVIGKWSARNQKPGARMTPAALDLMIQFDWPGNVRELENEIERALTLAGDAQEITPEHLSEKIAGSREDVPELDGSITLQAAVENLERQMVSRALKRPVEIALRRHVCWA
jgi:transcriptional regulator with PAS, ATPase and Fis domain